MMPEVHDMAEPDAKSITLDIIPDSEEGFSGALIYEWVASMPLPSYASESETSAT